MAIGNDEQISDALDSLRADPVRMMGEMQARLLRALYEIAESTDKRMASIEQSTNEIKERLASLERRVSELERR